MTDSPSLQAVVAACLDSYAETHRLSPRQWQVCAHVRDCRTEALGGLALRCDACGTEQPAYHSCRDRHCPRCQRRASADGAATKSRLSDISNQFDVEINEFWRVVYGLCDSGDIVVASALQSAPLYMTFSRWAREVERLERMARESPTADGRIPGISRTNIPTAGSVETAVVAQLVNAGCYSWEGSDLVRGRARRLSQPLRCFVSHASSDKPIAEAIAQILRSRNVEAAPGK